MMTFPAGYFIVSPSEIVQNQSLYRPSHCLQFQAVNQIDTTFCFFQILTILVNKQPNCQTQHSVSFQVQEKFEGQAHQPSGNTRATLNPYPPDESGTTWGLRATNPLRSGWSQEEAPCTCNSCTFEDTSPRIFCRKKEKRYFCGSSEIDSVMLVVL